MTILVTRGNTKLYKSADGGWIRVVYDTGALDAEGNAVTIEKRITTASIEKEAGVLLPKARIKALLQAELNAVQPAGETEMTAAVG